MARYHHRRQNAWGRHATFEAVISAAVIVLIVAMLGIFVFVFHDIPLRVP